MKAKVSTAAAVVALLLAGTPVSLAQEYPTFERDGYPITPLQLQVLGSETVREQEPPAALAGGMPASPHQVEVLRHHDQARH